MTITFISNFLNHHQLPLCKEMYLRFGKDFTFIATTPTFTEQLNLGYHDMNKEYDFVLTTYDSETNYNKALKIAYECDVVIYGSADGKFIYNRIKEDKLTFKYSERIFKRGRWRIFSPRALVSLFINHTRYVNKKNVYMLCSSAYAAGDFAIIGSYIGKTYKWGYFPDVIEYDLDYLFEKKKKGSVHILWVGRFLDWKHPEKVIFIAENLKKDGFEFIINMIGLGDMTDTISDMIKRNNLGDCVKLLGAMSPEDVRKHMEDANIFLFTSDYNEGWGAVLNEAMNSGCAVVASHAIGSVPFLIDHGINGLIYKNNKNDDLYLQVKLLMNDKELRHKLGEKAYLTMKITWNATNATNNFLKLLKHIMDKTENTIKNGPCSKAEMITQGKMYKYTRRLQ